jgi:hypothetical protein
MRAVTDRDIEEFETRGFVRVRGLVPRHSILQCHAALSSRIGQAQRSSPSDDEFIQIREEIRNDDLDECQTRDFESFFDQFVYPNRIAWHRHKSWGWWSIGRPRRHAGSWRIPGEGWHWDGLSLPLDPVSGRLGLVVLCLFTDVAPRGGATLLVAGSHNRALSYLAGSGKTASHPQAVRAVIGRMCLEKCSFGRATLAAANECLAAHLGGVSIHEATGDAGDLFVCHPLLMHAASSNHRTNLKILCNRHFSLEANHCPRSRRSSGTVFERILERHYHV